MGSPVGPALANIFKGFHEKRLLPSPNKLVVYFCYVDDTFCLFNNETEVVLFVNFLNKIHPALKFTLDKEKPARPCEGVHRERRLWDRTYVSNSTLYDLFIWFEWF